MAWTKKCLFYGFKRQLSQRLRAKGQRSKKELVRKERSGKTEGEREGGKQVVEREMSCENLVS